MANEKKIEAFNSLGYFLTAEIGLPFECKEPIWDALEVLKKGGIDSAEANELQRLIRYVVLELVKQHKADTDRLKADIRRVLDNS